MIRKFVLLLAAFSVLSTIPACTSKSSGGEEEILAEDGTSEELAGLALDEGGDAGFAESGDSTDLSLDLDASVADTATEDQLTIDSFGEGTDMANMDMGTEPVPEPGMTEEPLAPEPTDMATNTDMGMTDMAVTDSSSEMMSPPADEITPPTTTTEETAPSFMTDASSSADSGEDEKPKNIPVQKVAAEPWKSGSKWVNAIYFARPGDTLESISQTLYGDDRTSELKRINPTFKRRDVRPGDKVYYASAIRLDDNEKVLTYFEEKNIPSQSYVAKAGDNIRKVSRELLGYPEAWKEIWAYNPVESKQEIAEGTELRYWDSNAHLGGGAVSAPLAEMAPAGMPPSQPPIENMGSNDLPPPPPMPDMGDMGQDPSQDPSMAQSDFAPPPDLPPPPDMNGDAVAGGMNTADLPPPPPPMDLPPPPPPPPPVQAAPPPPAQASIDEGMADQDQTVMMGAVAAGALMLVALMVVRRKRKQKELEQALGETHVG